jgi:hypothetical protein
MTLFESSQPKGTFIEAGRIAWRLGIELGSNPYHGEQRKLWTNGYSREGSENRKIDWVYFSKELEEDFEAEERWLKKQRKL